MRPTKAGSFALLLAVLITTANVEAQDCEITDTLEDCWLNQLDEEASEFTRSLERTRASAGTEAATNRSETGIETLGANLGTTTKDFLTLLSTTGLIGTSMEGDDPSGTFTVDLNSLLPESLIHLGGKLQTVFQSEPKLYMPLKMLIAEDERAERVEDLEGNLSRTDDATVAFSINVETERLGRSFESSYSDLYADMFNEAIRPIDESSSNQQLITIALDIGRVPGGSCDDTQVVQCTFVQIAQDLLPPGAAKEAVEKEAVEIRRRWLDVVASEQQLAAAYRQAVVDNRLGSFAALVDNQPQLSFSLERSFKDVLVGPDEWALEVRYELPLAPNLNRLRKTAGEEISLDDFSDYVGSKQDQLEDSDRLLFSVKYMDRESLEVELEDIQKRFEGARAWEISAGWGKVLQRAEDAAALTRVDFVASWEDVSDDPDRQSRGLASLTIARKFGTVTVPIGIVYSNKPEFLQMQDIDEELSAHVGLKFNLEDLDP